METPEVDRYVRGDTECPGEDVALRMDGRLPLGQLAAADHLLGDAVVGGEKGHLAVVDAIGARVPDVDQREHVVTVLLDESDRSEGGAHPTKLGMLEAVLPDGRVGLDDGFREAHCSRLPAEHHPEGVDGHPSGDLSTRVATHPVRDREEVRRLHRKVLVDRADQAGVGSGARTEDGHFPTSNTVPPIWSRSPFSSLVRSSMRIVLTQVPLVEFRSSAQRSPSRRKRRAWRLEE